MGTEIKLPDWLEAEVADYYIPLQHHPKTVLDIGANVGGFSLRASEWWPDCTVQAYEPFPVNADLFRQVCPNDRFRFHESAVRSFSGQDSLRVGMRQATCGFKELGEQTNETITVKCVDALELDSAEFVKIDTEGCEVEILERLPLESTRAIACEFHVMKDRDWIINFLTERGFEVVGRKMLSLNRGILKFIRKGEKLVSPKKKLMIGLPIYGGVDVHFFASVMHLMAEFPVSCRVEMVPGDSLISRARNLLTMKFLHSDCTHFLQIDSDLSFTNKDIKRILSHDEDVIGGFYPKKKEGEAELVINTLENQPAMDKEREITELKFVGTGFICVSRRVIEKMIEVYGDQIMYVSDMDQKTIEYDLWPVGVYKYPNGYQRYLSEDWYFCQRARDLGFKVYGDNRIFLRHSGQIQYPLSYQKDELLRRVPANAASDSVPPVSLSPAQPVAALT